MAREGDAPRRARALVELAALFLRLGTTAFGGPAAHIAMFEDEVVRRRGWLSRERFLDKLMVDCAACPLNLCCDEVAMVRPPAAEGEFEPVPVHAHKEL